MDDEKSSDEMSSSLPVGGLVAVLVLLVCGVLFFALRQRSPGPSPSLDVKLWDRKIVVSGDAGTAFRYLFSRENPVEFGDREVPAIIEVPATILSVEIRDMAGSGSLDLKIQDQNGNSATTSLSRSNDYADLIISEKTVLWSWNRKHR